MMCSIFIFCVFVVIISLFVLVSLLNTSLNRIIANSGDISATTERTTRGMRLIRSFKGKVLDLSILIKRYTEFRFTASDNTIYSFVVICTVLSYVFYIYSTFKLRKHYF